MLRPLHIFQRPELIVGLHIADDAAVYKINDEQAIVETVDFFPPIVDDPYVYGGIAAANALSDVYAMGGEVLLALNIAGFPNNLDLAILTRILQGGADKVAEAGAVIAGGHTVVDAEPKYGLAVTGIVHPERVITKAGCQRGDRLVLTKPLGTGAITTAARADRASSADLAAAIESMLQLNRRAARIMQRVRIGGATDVTGFGLLGHLSEMALASRVGFVVHAGQIPLLPGAIDYAEQGILPGGAARNRDHLLGRHDGGEPRVHWSPAVPQPTLDLLFDPETSGGLLIAVPPDRLPMLLAEAAAVGQSVWEIGTAVAEPGILVEP